MPLDRRQFLLRAAALAAFGTTASARVLAQPRYTRDPYTLGVASGYPHASGVSLWTRLAPEPLAGGGMPAGAVAVRWEVAEDAGLRRIVASGTVHATSQWGHSVHVDVAGLQPARDYWYRFTSGDATSVIARTRTAPAADAAHDRLRLAVAACQQYEQGYYTAYRHMAREDLDLVVHLGDYIYESSWGRQHVRSHGSDQPYTLDEYRNRYALYKSDADLQAAHAAFAWIVTWDDHELQNDYANDRSQDLAPRDAFLLRRAAAYQAYYEHMPLPAWARPRGPDMRLHAELGYGALARFLVLDTRQYRSPQVCPRPGRGGSNVVGAEACPERTDPRLTMLGAQQERWLDERLAGARARWNIVAQQTPMAQADRRPGPGADYWTDGWDGYPQARARLLGAIAGHRVPNPLVLAGDVHMAAVTDLKIDFDDARAPAIASEFVCPSITSFGPSQTRVEALLQENAHIRFANGARRGYTTLDITPSLCTGRIRAIASATERDSPVRDLATYAVESGRAGAQRV